MAGATFGQTQSASLTLFLSGGYLFSGLMFGPDLDTYSRQYQRWGMVRWLWLPYRSSMRHRAFLSHGPVVGTIVRLVYLLIWLIALLGVIALVSAIAYATIGELEKWTQFSQQYVAFGQDLLGKLAQHHMPEAIALFLGMELGAMSHSCSDWFGSALKRQVKRHTKKLPVVKSSAVKAPSPLPSAQAIGKPPPSPPKSAPLLPTTVELPPLPRSAGNSQLPPFNG